VRWWISSARYKIAAVPDAEDSLSDDLAAGAVETIPVLGPILAPFAKRLSGKIREEWDRNTSEALRAAERASGMSRERLADRMSEDPRLIPLVVRVLYVAGMTGQDAILRALGTALGDAVRIPENIDEAEILLIGMADLRGHHIDTLKIMTERLPHPTEPDQFAYWTSESLANKSGYSRDLVNICIAGLVSSGLIRQADDAYGVAYEITELGRTALEVLNELGEKAEDKARPTERSSGI
jgi:hypothetical protein